MIRLLLCCLSWWALVATAFAQPQDDADRLWFTVTIEPDFVRTKGAYVGGEMVMHVRLVSPDPFKRLRLDLPDIEGVRTETLVRPHTRQISTLGAMGYSDEAGYSYEARLVIVPERSGVIVIPPIGVTGISESRDGRSFEFEEAFPAQSITVHPASPEFEGDVWIVSRRATFDDSWSPEIAAIQEGDTVRRRVVLSVAGVTAYDLPELILTSHDGYRVLSTEVSAETEKTKLGFIAHLEQSWDIYIETDDVIYIDGFRFPYWNPELKKTEVASVPRQRVEPLPRDALEQREQLRAGVLAEHRTKRLGLLVLLSLPAAGLFTFLALALWCALPRRADWRFWRASKQAGVPLEFYASFLSWGRQTFGTRTPAGQEHVSALGAGAADQVKRLHRSVFGPRSADVEPSRMAATLIWALRRMAIMRFMSATNHSILRFFFLR